MSKWKYQNDNAKIKNGKARNGGVVEESEIDSSLRSSQ